jgi:hypothetical protein
MRFQCPLLSVADIVVWSGGLPVFLLFLSDYCGFFASDQAITALGGGMASRATSLFRF